MTDTTQTKPTTAHRMRCTGCGMDDDDCLALGEHVSCCGPCLASCGISHSRKLDPQTRRWVALDVG